MKKLLISLITGLFVLSIVAQDTDKVFTLENIIKQNEFRAKGVYGLRSMADGKHYTTNERGNILVYAYKSGDLIDTLVKAEDLLAANPDKKVLPTESSALPISHLMVKKWPSSGKTICSSKTLFQAQKNRSPLMVRTEKL